MLLKQMLLGGALIVGGGVMVYAVINQQMLPTPTQTTPTAVSDDIAKPIVQSLPTVDVETEHKILQTKQAAREQATRQSEQELIALNQQREQDAQAATNRSMAEIEKTKRMQTTATELPVRAENLQVHTRPDAALLAQKQKEAQKKRQAELDKKTQPVQEKTTAEAPTKNTPNKSRHTVTKGDTLIGLSRTYGIPVSALAAANNMGRDDSLQRGKIIHIPSQAEVSALQKKANADSRLSEARKQAKQQGINDRYSVQVSLADNADKAKRLAEQYKKAGYKVSTVNDIKGVRVLIGPEPSKEAARALRDKLIADKNVNATGAWVFKAK